MVDGLPIIHIQDLSEKTATNREEVVGMNPLGGPVGMVDGPKSYTLDVTVYVPKTGDISWENITNGTIARAGIDGGVPTALYQGVFVKDVSTDFKEKGAATRKISMGALIKVET